MLTYFELGESKQIMFGYVKVKVVKYPHSNNMYCFYDKISRTKYAVFICKEDPTVAFYLTLNLSNI